MRSPGEVWYLPPESREGGDRKGRRHLLLTACRDHDDVGVLSYASTSAIEGAFGGGSFLLDPHSGAYRQTGFDRPTYITPCRLVSALSHDMVRMMGRVIDEMPHIRLVLHHALGLGTGTADSGRAFGSFRGRVAVLSDSLAREIDCRFAIIVTEPVYSLAERYQLILPILNGEEYESEDGDVLVGHAPWLDQVQLGSGAILPTRLIQSAFHPSDLAHTLPICVDEATISRIDSALVELFGL
jgi:hypothetical protein